MEAVNAERTQRVRRAISILEHCSNIKLHIIEGHLERNLQWHGVSIMDTESVETAVWSVGVQLWVI